MEITEDDIHFQEFNRKNSDKIDPDHWYGKTATIRTVDDFSDVEFPEKIGYSLRDHVDPSVLSGKSDIPRTYITNEMKKAIWGGDEPDFIQAMRDNGIDFVYGLEDRDSSIGYSYYGIEVDKHADNTKYTLKLTVQSYEDSPSEIPSDETMLDRMDLDRLNNDLNAIRARSVQKFENLVDQTEVLRQANHLVGWIGDQAQDRVDRIGKDKLVDFIEKQYVSQQDINPGTIINQMESQLSDRLEATARAIAEDELPEECASDDTDWDERAIQLAQANATAEVSGSLTSSGLRTASGRSDHAIERTDVFPEDPLEHEIGTLPTETETMSPAP